MREGYFNGEVLVWAEPIVRGDLRVVPRDIQDALTWFKDRTGQEAKLIILHPKNEHLGKEVTDGIAVEYLGGCLRGEVWLSAKDNFVPAGHEGYFNIAREKQYPCWCEACFSGKTEEQMSQKDKRFCVDCQQVIEGEYRLEAKTTWSDCGQVFFVDGKGYALTSKLRTICLGGETDIRGFFETGKPNNELNLAQRLALLEIQEYRKEQGIGTTIGTKGLERTDRDGTTRGNQKTTRLSAARKRLPQRPSRKVY